MLFNSHLFLLVFLPVTFILFEAVPKRHRMWVLFLASMVFYRYSGLKPLGAMLFSIFWVYTITTYMEFIPRQIKKLLVVIGPLSILFMFRYLDFAFESIGFPQESRASFSFFLDVLVPAGISFYTFQIMAYGLDALDRTIDTKPRLLNLITFISFFPQLIAGPIVRYKQVSTQFEAIQLGKSLNRNFCDGVQLIVIGLAYKVLIADMMGLLHSAADGGSAAHAGTIDIWLSVIIYSFQIYYDFYGYSLIAIGLGKLFGIELPINFNRPYLAPNPKLFWKRWHMTLSQWLFDYVYLKMGGNKNYVINILIVFAAVGLWHGADWSFVVWGLYHASLVIGYHFSKDWWERLPDWLQIGGCFFLISMGWPLFYFDLGEYMSLLPRLVTLTHELRSIYQIQEIGFIGLIAIWTFLPRSAGTRLKERLWTYSRLPVCQACMLVILFLMFGNSTDFIYFRF